MKIIFLGRIITRKRGRRKGREKERKRGRGRGRGKEKGKGREKWKRGSEETKLQENQALIISTVNCLQWWHLFVSWIELIEVNGF